MLMVMITLYWVMEDTVNFECYLHTVNNLDRCLRSSLNEETNEMLNELGLRGRESYRAAVERLP